METTGFIHSPGSLISRVMLIEELKEFVSASGLAEAIYIADAVHSLENIQVADLMALLGRVKGVTAARH